MLTSDVAARLSEHARITRERGDLILHLQVEVSQLTGEKSSWGSADNALSGDESIGYFLGEIEKIGWRLEHTGYTFVESGATSSARMLSTGTGVVNHGVVAGYFTFRRA